MFEKGVTCMTRREARELAFILLFEMSFTGEPVGTILENAAESRDVEGDAFALSLAEGAAAHLEEEDTLISAFSRKWNKDRLSRVALSIMRLAIYEMEHEENIPVSVSINEAVELAKKYGGRTMPPLSTASWAAWPQRRSRVRNRRAETITGEWRSPWDCIWGWIPAIIPPPLRRSTPGRGVIWQAKRPLPVKEGELGLRQSDAVFSIPDSFPRCSNGCGRISAAGLCCSTGWRPLTVPVRRRVRICPAFGRIRYGQRAFGCDGGAVRLSFPISRAM